MNTTIYYKAPPMWIQHHNKQMKYHKQMLVWRKQFIVKQIQPFVDLIEANRALPPFGRRGLTKVASSLNEKPGQMDGCVLTL